MWTKDQFLGPARSKAAKSKATAFMKRCEMVFAAREFSKFESELAKAGFGIHEIEKVPYQGQATTGATP